MTSNEGPKEVKCGGMCGCKTANHFHTLSWCPKRPDVIDGCPNNRRCLLVDRTAQLVQMLTNRLTCFGPRYSSRSWSTVQLPVRFPLESIVQLLLKFPSKFPLKLLPRLSYSPASKSYNWPPGLPSCDSLPGSILVISLFSVVAPPPQKLFRAHYVRSLK